MILLILINEHLTKDFFCLHKSDTRLEKKHKQFFINVKKLKLN